METLHARRKTRLIKVGKIFIGGDNPVSIQTMWKEPITILRPEIIDEIAHLQLLGCDIIRFAVPDINSAKIIGKMCEQAALPIVADIHFDYRIALSCLDYNFAKIRLNPGTIGARWKIREIAEKAKDRGIPIRIGVNAGSLPPSLRTKDNTPEAMVKAAEAEVEILESLAFSDIIVSLKSSDLEYTMQANRLFSADYDYPLHIGLTEAGPLIDGIVKNSIAISRLLREGIGDTLRVSLSAPPVDEIITGRAILIAENMYERGLRIISCPTCGRTTFDVRKFLEENRDFLYSIQKNATVAVMGCTVNGPGEAKEADIGITGSGNSVVLFKHGKEIARLRAEAAVKRFREELEKL